MGSHLASRLNLPIHEMDSLIVERSKLASIPEIFELHGEPFFRDLESEVAEALASHGSCVISTGGGVVGRPHNMERLTAHGGVVVFLRTSFDTVSTRNEGLETRPLFKDGKRARALFNERTPLYERWATIVVDTDNRSVDEVCSEIISRLEARSCRP